MKRNRFLIFLITIFSIFCVVGTTYSAYIFINPTNTSNTIQSEVTTWSFTEDQDFAKTSNLLSSVNLNITRETNLTQNSVEAIRMTSTTGTSTKDHTININLDRDYYLSEIQFYKFEFDYYHRYKREQYNKGFPTVQFTINNSTLGSGQGGTDTCTDTSPFVAIPIDEDWWHLEYYIFAHIPTVANSSHGDSPIALTKKINGVRVNDRTMYDYAGTTAFAIIDNMIFSAEPGPRLGIFNRWTSAPANSWFWFKIAFSGQLHSVKLYSSDTSVAVPEFDPTDTVSTSYPFPNGSPFYFRLLQAGSVRFTAELELGDDHEVFTIISDPFPVT